MNLQENALFDLDLGVKITQNIAQFPLHHVIYASTKFEVATSYGLGEDTITRRMDDGPILVPGLVAQSVTCLPTDACLTADPGVASSIPPRYHTFVEIDHEIISTVILLPSADLFKKGC